MKYFPVILFLVLCSGVFAQQEEPIVTDRPTQSASVSTVGAEQVLIESGFIFQNESAFEDYINFNTLVRYGVNDRVEVRLTVNYDRNEGSDFISSSLGQTTLGAKVFLADAQETFADISVLGQLNLPTGEENDNATADIRLNFQNSLSSTLSLGYNFGFLVSPERDNEISPFYSVVLGAAVADGWTVFAEPYGFLNTPVDHRFNAGFIYLVAPRFQIDLSGGIGLSENSPNSFIGFGAAFGF